MCTCAQQVGKAPALQDGLASARPDQRSELECHEHAGLKKANETLGTKIEYIENVRQPTLNRRSATTPAPFDLIMAAGTHSTNGKQVRRIIQDANYGGQRNAG
jgi:hypothetical protein